MGTEPLLTVAILTFDRNEILKANLAKLLPQMTPDCALLILDNHSPTPVADTLADLLAQYPNVRVDIVRHRVNIGGNANIVRCFELCETEWMWLLGDDDEPQPNAIIHILAEMAVYPEPACITFSSRAGELSPSLNITSLHELLHDSHRLTALGFISLNIYRASLLKKYCEVGNQYSYSCYPHVAMLLAAVAGGAALRITSHRIVDWTAGATRWSFSPIYLGITTLTELPMPPQCRSHLARRLTQEWYIHVRGICLHYLTEGLRSGDLKRSEYLFRLSSGRLILATGAFWRWPLHAAFQFAFRFPQLALRVDTLLRRLLRREQFPASTTS